MNKKLVSAVPISVEFNGESYRLVPSIPQDNSLTCMAVRDRRQVSAYLDTLLDARIGEMSFVYDPTKQMLFNFTQDSFNYYGHPFSEIGLSWLKDLASCKVMRMLSGIHAYVAGGIATSVRTLQHQPDGVSHVHIHIHPVIGDTRAFEALERLIVRAGYPKLRGMDSDRSRMFVDDHLRYIAMARTILPSPQDFYQGRLLQQKYSNSDDVTFQIRSQYGTTTFNIATSFDYYGYFQTAYTIEDHMKFAVLEELIPKAMVQQRRRAPVLNERVFLQNVVDWMNAECQQMHAGVAVSFKPDGFYFSR